MKVSLHPTAEIKLYEKNSRLNDGAVDAVAESIRRFGFRQPIVVDADGVIVCGHTRWKAAQRLKLIDDLHPMRRTITDSGNVRYAAPRESGSHADRWTALALALQAAGNAPIHPPIRWVPYQNSRSAQWAAI